MYATLVQFAEMRKLDRVNLVVNFDLFPQYDTLMIFERKYGDSISYYDQHGVQKKKRRRRKARAGSDDNNIAGSVRAESIEQTVS
jgi:hypothetical protein